MRQTTVTPPRFAGDILTIGFATTVAMWGLAYFAHLPKQIADLPQAALPNWLLLLIITLMIVVAGFLTGWLSGRGWIGGLCVGLVVGVLNLLVLGGILTGGESGHLPLAALAWAPLST